MAHDTLDLIVSLLRNDLFKTLFNMFLGGIISALIGYIVNIKIRIKKDLELKAAEDILNAVATAYDDILGLTKSLYTVIYSDSPNFDTQASNAKKMLCNYNMSIGILQNKLELWRLVICDLWNFSDNYILELLESKNNLMTIKLTDNQEQLEKVFEDIVNCCDNLIRACAELKIFAYKIQTKLYGQYFNNNTLERIQNIKPDVYFTLIKEQLLKEYSGKYINKVS